MIKTFISKFVGVSLAIFAIGTAAPCLTVHADDRIDYVKSDAAADQTTPVSAAVGGAPGTNGLSLATFQLEYAVNNGSCAFQTSLTASNTSANASNFVFGLKTSIDPSTVGMSDTIIWVTNTTPTTSNTTTRAINTLTNLGQARYIGIVTNINFETNGMKVSTKFGQHRSR